VFIRKAVADVTVARSQKDAGPTDRPTPHASAVLKISAAFRDKEYRTRTTWHHTLRREREGRVPLPACFLLVGGAERQQVSL
jgi:hypothetical protein